MPNIKNKIEATDTSISALLKDQKCFIDYFQRAYRWQEKHMLALIGDLTEAFLQSYNPSHKRSEVANYKSYCLGPVVFSVTEGENAIIDGQQDISSYLKNPNFKNSGLTEVPFQAHEAFKLADIEKRNEVVKSLGEIIWSPGNLKVKNETL